MEDFLEFILGLACFVAVVGAALYFLESMSRIATALEALSK